MRQPHLSILTAAPHRPFFLLGAVQLLLPMLFWALELAGRTFGVALLPGPALPASWLHPVLLLFGLFPFFIFGFLMTTFPRWLRTTPIARHHYSRVAALMGLGMGLAWLGVWGGVGLFAFGFGVWLLGLAIGVWHLLQVTRGAKGADRFYEWSLLVALGVALLAGLQTLVSLLNGNWACVGRGVQLGLWLFLIPLLLLVAHRMLPFFSSVVIPQYRLVQPRGLLLGLWPALLLHLGGELGQLPLLRLAGDLPLLLGGLYLARHWGFWAARREKLLWVLHLAFAAFPLGMGLFVLQALVELTSGELWLARAPLHTLTIGFAGAMVIAMATRVSRGHSGRTLALDGLSWLALRLLGLVLALRVAAELPLGWGVSSGLNLAAALLWLGALGPWVWRYGRIYLSPRVDGQPG